MATVELNCRLSNDGRDIKVNIALSENVAALKAAIFKDWPEGLNVPTTLRLFVNGQALADSVLLSSYKLQDKSSVMVVGSSPQRPLLNPLTPPFFATTPSSFFICPASPQLNPSISRRSRRTPSRVNSSRAAQ